MQSKTEDEIPRRILAVLLEIEDETKLCLREGEIFIILELFYSIILEH